MGFALMSCVTILVVGSVEAVVETAQVNKGRAGQSAAMLRREIPPVELRIKGLGDDDYEERDDEGTDDEGLTPYHRDRASRKADHESEMSGLEDDDSEGWDDDESEMSPTSAKVKKIKPRGSKEHDDLGLSPTNAKVKNVQSEDSEDSEEHEDETDGAAYKSSNSSNASNASNAKWDAAAGSDGHVAASGHTRNSTTDGGNSTDLTNGASKEQGELDGLTESEMRHRIERAAAWAEKIERRANELEKTGQNKGLQKDTENRESAEKRIERKTESAKGRNPKQEESEDV
jgi:hypothetical protein